jgi:DNA repair protein RadD
MRCFRGGLTLSVLKIPFRVFSSLSDLINREQLRETLRKKQQDVSSVVSTTDLPVQPQARRVQSRKRLSQRTNSVVARILKDLGLAPNGREVGKRNKKVAGRDNRAAVSDLLNKAINEHLGIAQVAERIRILKIMRPSLLL